MSTLETSNPTAVEGRGPYVGLTAYTERDAAIFFGRDAERRVLISNLRASRLTLLYARSGTGKSSLLRAGVEARLRQVAERNRAQRGAVSKVPVILGSWHDEPTERLIEAVEAALVDIVPEKPLINLPRTGLVDALEAATSIADATLLVILDQFEEYLLAPSVEAGGRRFADELAECLNRPELRANFLVAIREDAYSRLGDVFQSRIQNVYGNYLHLADLNRIAAEEAITQPIEHVNELHADLPPIEIEPALVQAVLDQLARSDEVGLDPSDGGVVVRTDSADGSGGIAAPYLQLVMQRLWGAEVERRVADDDPVRLRLETLAELGGAGMIVRTHVDRVLRDLSGADRDAAVDMFRHLVTRSGTKIALAPSDLAEYTGCSEGEVRGLLGHLTQAGVRILHDVPPSPGTQTPRFEISHDLLAMPILDWCARAQQERAAAQADADARRHRRRTLIGAGALLALVAVLASLSTWALIERNNAQESSQHAKWVAVASTAKDLADSRLGDALVLGLAAYQNDATPAARSAVISALEQAEHSGARTILIGHTGAVLGIDVSSDGTVASSGQDGTVRMWDVARGREIGAPMKGHHGAVRAVAFSPDGQTIASGGDDNTVRLWARRTRTLVRSVDLPGPAIGVAFSPDGALVAVASQGARVFIIDRRARLRTHVLVTEQGGRDLTRVAFSPDGGTLAAASQDGKVFVWPTTALKANPAPRPTKVMDATSVDYAVLALAFDPSGRMLATGGGDNVVRVWDTRTSAQLWQHRLPAAVGDVAFSPDGRTLATTDGHGALRLWDAQNGKHETVYTGHVGTASGVVFSPDGRTLTTAGFDGTLRVWVLPPDRVLGRVVWRGSHPEDVNGVAYAPDGTLVSVDEHGYLRLWAAQPATTPRWEVKVPNGEELHAVARTRNLIAMAGDDGDVLLWDATASGRRRTLKAGGDAVLSVAFSRDGRLVAGGSEDGTVRVWRTATGVAVGRAVRTGKTQVNGVAFGPRGRVLATASADGRVRLWTIPGLKHIGTSAQGAARTGIAFSPEGDTIAAAGADGTVRLLDARTLTQQGGALVGHTGPVQAVAFSAHGRTLASVGFDGSLRLWDPVTHAELGDPLTGRDGRVNAVAFSPGGTTLATSGADGTVRTWTGMLWRSRADLEGRVCRRVSRNLTRGEWESLVPDAPYSRPCRSR